MAGITAGVGCSARLRGAIISAAPLFVLGFTMFVVALNMRHYSTCDTESARDAALNRAAMERRIKALETEILQNSVFLEKLLHALDTAFHASALLSVKELRELARVEASEIGQRRSRQPPPPMSSFARSRVSKAVDGGRLQDLVEAALGSEASSFSIGGGGGGGSGAFVDSWPREENGGNSGWDWGPAESSAADDFLQKKEVEVVQPVKLDVSDEERESSCRTWLKDHGVTPQIDWGTLPVEQQQLWTQYRCDDVALEPLAGDPGTPVGGEPSGLPGPEGNGDGMGAGQAAAAAAAAVDGGRDADGSGRASKGEQDGEGSHAAADAADEKLDEGSE